MFVGLIVGNGSAVHAEGAAAAAPAYGDGNSLFPAHYLLQSTNGCVILGMYKMNVFYTILFAEENESAAKQPAGCFAVLFL
jgi:hypothetical protein